MSDPTKQASDKCRWCRTYVEMRASTAMKDRMGGAWHELCAKRAHDLAGSAKRIHLAYARKAGQSA